MEAERKAPLARRAGSAGCAWIISPTGSLYRECGMPATHRDPQTGEGMCDIHAEDYADIFGSDSLQSIESEPPNAE